MTDPIPHPVDTHVVGLRVTDTDRGTFIVGEDAEGNRGSAFGPYDPDTALRLADQMAAGFADPSATDIDLARLIWDAYVSTTERLGPGDLDWLEAHGLGGLVSMRRQTDAS